MKTYSLSIAILLFTMMSCAVSKRGTQSSQKGQYIITSLHELEQDEQCFSGFILYDPITQDTLFKHRHDKYFTPASNTKILTLFAALSHFDDSIPSVQYIDTDSALHIIGLADPSVFNPYIVGGSRLRSFLKSTEKKLVLHIPHFDDLRKFGPGWSWDDYDAYYQCEKTAFPMFGNCLHIDYSIDSGWTTIPDFPLDLRINIEQEKREFIAFRREAAQNRFYLDLNATPIEDTHYEIPFTWDDNLLVDLLSNETQKDVQISYIPIPDSLKTSAKTFYNVCADSLYARLMQISDNFVAEQLMMGISYQLFGDFESRKAIDSLLKNELNTLPDKIQWVDGSGLSRYNLTTPRNTMTVLNNIFHIISEKRLMAIFAQGGKTGTIRNWYAGEEDAFVFAKTGTLRNKHALSGYIKTNTGRVLIFSFMHENYVNGTRPVKEKMEEILIYIKHAY